MLISIIVPVYNVEKYLCACLDSLRKQTYNDIEVIMVDDGSKDSSGKICDKYAEKYSNFYVIHKKNAGLGMARNTGLEYVKGDYVTFVDSDDYLEPECLEILYKNLIEHNADLCKGGFKRVIDSGDIVSIRNYQYEYFKDDDARLKLLPRMIGSSPFQHDSVEMCVCGALYKTAPIKKFGLKFPSERELISEDLVFNIDYMQHARIACLIPETGYIYRVNLKSLSTSYRADRFKASKYFYLEMKRKLEKLGYDNSTFLRLDRMFFVYLRMCICQERPIASQNKEADSIRNINDICYDNVVRDVIRNYPKNKLGIKQQLFLALIWYKMKNLLYFMVKRGILR